MRKVAGAAWFISAILMLDTAIGLATLLVFFSFVLEQAEIERVMVRGPSVFGYLVLYAVLAVVAVLLYRRGERTLQQPVEEVLLHDKRRPILYLRSFSDDFASQPLTRFISLHNYRAEETLVLLNCLGPFIAIGRPGEALPLIGANRHYVNDSEWKTKVMRLT